MTRASALLLVIAYLLTATACRRKQKPATPDAAAYVPRTGPASVDTKDRRDVELILTASPDVEQALKKRLRSYGLRDFSMKRAAENLHVQIRGLFPDEAQSIQTLLHIGKVELVPAVMESPLFTKAFEGAKGLAPAIRQERSFPYGPERTTLPVLIAESEEALTAYLQESGTLAKLPNGQRLLLEKQRIRDTVGTPMTIWSTRLLDASGALPLVPTRAVWKRFFGSSQVTLTLAPENAKALADWSKAQVGKPIGVVVDGRVVSFPVVQEPLTGGQAAVSLGHDTSEFEGRLQAMVYGAPIAGHAKLVSAKESVTQACESPAACRGGCERGSAIDCMTWAEGTSGDEQADAHRAACRLGIPQACERTCTKHSLDACREAAAVFADGPPRIVDVDRASRFFELACAWGHAQSCIAAVEANTDYPDWTAIRQLYQAACGLGTCGPLERLAKEARKACERLGPEGGSNGPPSDDQSMCETYRTMAFDGIGMEKSAKEAAWAHEQLRHAPDALMRYSKEIEKK